MNKCLNCELTFCVKICETCNVDFWFVFCCKVTGNLLLFVSLNAIGLYIHDKINYALHKVFDEASNCIAARIDVEDESAKLVSSELHRRENRRRGREREAGE